MDRRAWATAARQFRAAAQERPLGLSDLESLATALHLLGEQDEALAVLARAHREALRADVPTRAARHAFWLALTLADQGRRAEAAGWVARGQRVLAGQPPSVEEGYLLVPSALEAIAKGDLSHAAELFERISMIAERFGDPDLAAMATLGHADVLIGRADVRGGMTLLDEAMVAVTMGEVSAVVAGIVYCSTIESCRRLFDLRRVQEWTEALGRWVETQPQLVAYRGACLLRRAELMTLRGNWAAAIDEVRRARDHAAGPAADDTVGAAWYQEAEILRLQGQFPAAEEAYRQSARRGRRPEPGLALLRLEQHRPAAAATAIDRALAEADDPASRPMLLDAKLDIALALGDLASAEVAADQLGRVAGDTDSPLLQAIAARAKGAVLLAAGGGRDALAPLKRAWAAYMGLGAAYEAAWARVLIARACRAIDDEESARLELGAARAAFEGLGARPALRHVDALLARDRTSDGLTTREIEVLRLVALGGSNRRVAAQLTISEKTVARHLSNIFTKLGVESRVAATAYAYEHDLVHPPA
jgi:DNA-binding NarL/FixJ family response regulator